MELKYQRLLTGIIGDMCRTLPLHQDWAEVWCPRHVDEVVATLAVEELLVVVDVVVATEPSIVISEAQ
jgi:hypothetical protein